MSTTTSYGTWLNLTTEGGVPGSPTTRVMIKRALGEFVEEYDVDAIEADYGLAINEALPEGIFFDGNEFYGPAPMPQDGQKEIREALSSLDTDVFWAIVARHFRGTTRL